MLDEVRHLTLKDLNFTENFAKTQGGAIYIPNNKNVLI